ncbi:hypothetical protein [Dyadobacter sp. CY347]|uniref:hypothetical protein n=1 Tax=Dyadobacter sp. CY347 TaxID=2909336 RepID=UPI001F3168C4|nr:hypothetical protein [Dyadobacter sp. CY347]MCF2487507.1 hypothetical protein [Dyadobacter sp. CY347]
MTGYELTRQWWDFSFENQDLVGSKHCALYMWIIEKNNRLGWVENFGFPMDEAGAAIGIRKIQTVREALNDLVEWGFVRMVIKSQNQYKANVISIINCTIESGECLDNALRLTEKRLTTGLSTGQAPGQARVNQPVEHGSSTVPIVKQTNNETNKPINSVAAATDDGFTEVESFDVSTEEKKKPSPKVAAKGSPKFDPTKVDLPFTGKEFSAAWLAWIKHRQEIKKPLTETAVDQQLKKLSGFDEPTATAIILQTVEKGWQGIVYELRAESKWQPNAPPGKGNIQKNYESVLTAEQRILQKRGLN